MSILAALQPHHKAGMKLAKTLMKAAIRQKATPAVAAIAALEILSVAAEQTETYLPAFLSDISKELHAVCSAQNTAALNDANPDQPVTTESST